MGRTACIAVARFQPLPHKGKLMCFSMSRSRWVRTDVLKASS